MVRQQELKICKRIGYEFYCEELFVVKHKSKYSCEIQITSLVLHQVREVGTVIQKEINSTCKTFNYISLVLTILGLVMVLILHYKKSKLCRGCMFSNTIKIRIIISDVQYSVPIKLYKTAENMCLFKIIAPPKSENTKLNQIYVTHCKSQVFRFFRCNWYFL